MKAVPPLAAILLGTLALGRAALAGVEPPCAPFAELRDLLKVGYGEGPVSAGISAEGDLVQIFATADGATWTAVKTTPAGLACIVATGKGWRQAPTGAES